MAQSQPAVDPVDHEFRDQLLADDLAQNPSEYVREQRARDDWQLEAGEILEGLRALDVGGDSVRWAIARVGHPDPSLNGHLVTWATSQLDADVMRDQFGGGKYYIKGRRSNGDYAGHKTVTIAGDAPRRMQPGAATAMPVTSPAAGLTDFLSAQERRDREREEREEKRRADRERLILAALPSAATVFAAMFTRPQVDLGALAMALKPAPGPDPLQMIAALKQLAPEAPKEQPNALVTAIDAAERITQLTGANTAGQVGFMDILKELVHVAGPAIGPMMQSAMERAEAAKTAPSTTTVTVQPTGNTFHAIGSQIPAGPALPQPAAPPAQARVSLPPAVAGDERMLELLPHLNWLKAQLQKLQGASARGRDPTLYAAMLLEELPAGLKPEKVKELLSRADWWDLLAGFGAAVAQRPWWEEMREALLEYITEAETQPGSKEKAAPEGLLGPGQLKVPNLTGEIE